MSKHSHSCGPRSHVHRLCLVVVMLLVMAVEGTAVAAAHAALIASDPVANASLATAPSRVTATFNEPMQPEFAAMTVIGPDRAVWSAGAPEVRGTQVSIGLRPLGLAGTYTVNYRATSADGHVVSGAWSFTLTQPRPEPTGSPQASAPAPPTAPPPKGGLPAWPFLAGAVALIALGAAWAVRRRT